VAADTVATPAADRAAADLTTPTPLVDPPADAIDRDRPTPLRLRRGSGGAETATAAIRTEP